MKKPKIKWVGFDYVFIHKENFLFNNRLQCFINSHVILELLH